MKQAIILLALFAIAFPTKSQSVRNLKPVKQKEVIQKEDQKNKAVDPSIEIFPAKNGWGYRIYIDKKLYVDQPHIPVVAGTQPFKTEEDAMRTAELVVAKIRQNILPPTVSEKELLGIGVIAKNE